MSEQNRVGKDEALSLSVRKPHEAWMLTGTLMTAARHMAGFRSRAEFATACGLSRATIERAEGCRDEFPKMGCDDMAKVLKVLEAHGLEFSVPPGVSPTIGLQMRKVR